MDYEQTQSGDLNKSGISLLRYAQTKYSSDFVPFFQELEARLKAPRGIGGKFTHAEEVDQVTLGIVHGAFRAAQQVVQMFGTLMGAQGRPGTKEDVQKLREHMRTVDKALHDLSSHRNGDVALDYAIAAAETRAKIRLNTLQDQHAVIQKGIETMQQNPNFFASVVAMASKSKLVQGALTAALGPFSALAGAAYGGIASMTRSMRQRKISQQQYALAGALTPAAEATSENILKRYSSIRESGRSIDRYADMAGSKGSSFSSREKTQKREKLSLPIEQTGIFAFFDKGAFKARWTKDIYDKVMKGATVGAAAGAGGGLAAAAMKMEGALALIGGMAGPIWMAADFIRGVLKTNTNMGIQPGMHTGAGSYFASGVGTMLGGTGPGVGERGATIGQQIANVLAGSLKGALMGTLYGNPIGGAVAGAQGHMIGGKRMAQGFQGAGDWMSQLLTGDRAILGAQGAKALNVDPSTERGRRITHWMGQQGGARGVSVRTPENVRATIEDPELYKQSILVKTIQNENNKVVQSVKELTAAVKQQSKDEARAPKTDMHTTGDPWADSANMGLLTVEN